MLSYFFPLFLQVLQAPLTLLQYLICHHLYFFVTFLSHDFVHFLFCVHSIPPLIQFLFADNDSAMMACTIRVIHLLNFFPVL